MGFSIYLSVVRYQQIRTIRRMAHCSQKLAAILEFHFKNLEAYLIPSYCLFIHSVFDLVLFFFLYS